MERNEAIEGEMSIDSAPALVLIAKGRLTRILPAIFLFIAPRMFSNYQIPKYGS